MTRSGLLSGVLLLLATSVVGSTPLQWRLPHPVRATGVYVYADPVSQLRLNVPQGWGVRAETLNGIRQLRVVPPKADQRERAAIDVVIRVRPLLAGESLERMAAYYKVARGDREAADVLRYLSKDSRLAVEYREGRYVSSRLWIVRRNLALFQRLDQHRLLEASCAANASEYKTYRRNLETICYSVAYGK